MGATDVRGELHNALCVAVFNAQGAVDYAMSAHERAIKALAAARRIAEFRNSECVRTFVNLAMRAEHSAWTAHDDAKAALVEAQAANREGVDAVAAMTQEADKLSSPVTPTAAPATPTKSRRGKGKAKVSP